MENWRILLMGSSVQLTACRLNWVRQQLLCKVKIFHHFPPRLFESLSDSTAGSGWGWLGYDKTSSKLVITTCANQDPLEATTGLVPLLGIDVWEHAYYLQVKVVHWHSTYSLLYWLNQHIMILKILLYFSVQERSPGLCKKHLENHQLARCCRAPCCSEKIVWSKLPLTSIFAFSIMFTVHILRRFDAYFMRANVERIECFIFHNSQHLKKSSIRLAIYCLPSE